MGRADTPDELVAIDIRHRDIGDEQMHRARGEQPQRTLRAITLQHRRAPLVQDGVKEAARVWLIVHDHGSVPFDPACGKASLGLRP